MRALLIAKRSGREARITCLNQLRHLGFCAPDELRECFRGLPRDQLADVAAALRPRSDSDPVTYATNGHADHPCQSAQVTRACWRSSAGATSRTISKKADGVEA
jgi:hypothetical protein